MNRTVSLAEIAQITDGRVLGDPGFLVHGVSSLRAPVAGTLAFAKDATALNQERLRNEGLAVLVPNSVRDIALPGVAVENPRLAFAQVTSTYFAPERRIGVSASAHIHPTAKIGENVGIGEGCVVGAGCEIGDGTELRHHVVLGDRVKVGRDCLIKSHAVIGEEGFGFEQATDGTYVRIAHLGSVLIEDEVEIGATTVIAQGTIDCTVIGKRTKIDDHVFIAHNCIIGEDVMIIAHAEISGSCKVGRGAWIGPNAAILNGLTLGENCFVGMGAVVTKPTEPNGIYAGSPARLLRYKNG